MIEEHRGDRRAPWSGAASLDLGSHVITCRGINLSQGGICFKGPWCPAEGELVAMKLHLFDREVRARGRVVWTRPERGGRTGGIEFTAVPHEGTQLLAAYVDGMAPSTVVHA
jgi:hypothetical protein